MNFYNGPVTGQDKLYMHTRQTNINAYNCLKYVYISQKKTDMFAWSFNVTKRKSQHHHTSVCVLWELHALSVSPTLSGEDILGTERWQMFFTPCVTPTIWNWKIQEQKSFKCYSNEKPKEAAFMACIFDHFNQSYTLSTHW